MALADKYVVPSFHTDRRHNRRNTNDIAAAKDQELQDQAYSTRINGC